MQMHEESCLDPLPPASHAAAHSGMTEGRRCRLKASGSDGERDMAPVGVGRNLFRRCGGGEEWWNEFHPTGLEPEDLAGLTVKAAAMAGVTLAGTIRVPGRGGYRGINPKFSI